jgi:hypothetical protein
MECFWWLNKLRLVLSSFARYEPLQFSFVVYVKKKDMCGNNAHTEDNLTEINQKVVILTSPAEHQHAMNNTYVRCDTVCKPKEIISSTFCKYSE